MANFAKKCWFYIKKVLLYTALIIYLILAILPLILLYLDKEIIICGLYNLGLNLKDVITPWITFCGGGGAAIGIYQMHRRVTNQEKQTQLQQKQLSDTRFSSGVELLGNANESVRISGIYSLYFLTKEYPDIYLDTVCEILCVYVRTITNKSKYQEEYKEKPSNEIQTIIDLLFNKDWDKDGKTIFYSCSKNLEGVFLSGIEFDNAIFDNVSFDTATLTYVDFFSAKLTYVSFELANLNNVSFDAANLDNVYCRSTNLNNVSFNHTNLNNVAFFDVTLENINFNNAKLDEEVDFRGTILEEYSYEDITRYDFSLVIGDKIIVENKPF